MNQRKISLEAVLYTIAFAGALAVRMTNLGLIPLNNGEAELALRAQAAALGQSPLIGPHPAYIALTTALFFFFGAANEAARFFPALAGSLLVLLPVFFRRWISRQAALLLAFLLVFDPTLVAISRQAGSQSLAVFFVLLALGFWANRQMLAAAAAAGLALLGGPAVWPGLIGLIFAFWASGASDTAGKFDNRITNHGDEAQAEGTGSNSWRKSLFAGLAAFFLIGTLFFTLPNGINAAAESLPAYLRGWVEPAGVSLALMLGTLLSYAFLPLVFAVWGAVSGLLRRDWLDRSLLLWWVFALLLTAAYPGRSLADLVWSVIPMWVLAARQISRMLNVPGTERAPVIGQAILTGIILSYISLTSAAIVNSAAVSNQIVLARLAAALFLLFASTGLVAWGWTRMIALRGFVLGLFAILLAYSLSAGWDAAGHSGQAGRELWSGGVSPSGASLLVQTIDDLNRWGPKESGGLDIVVVEDTTPALRWLLRDYRRVAFVDQLTADKSPALVVTPERPELALAATYRGQGFTLFNEPLWSALQPVEWLRWFIFRVIPGNAVVQNRVILWARLDVFPVNEEQTIPQNGSQQGADDGSEGDLEAAQ